MTGDRQRYTIDLTEAQVHEYRALLPAGSLRKKPKRRRKETEDYIATLKQMVAALARRAEGDVDQLPGLTELREQVEDVIFDHIERARAIGVPWSEIGERISTSKQGAEQWYSRRRRARTTTTAGRQRIVDGLASVRDAS